MELHQEFFDLHCHLLPGLDDGPIDWDGALESARAAVSQGVGSAVTTTHQLGVFTETHADAIRKRTARYQQLLSYEGIPLCVWPGAEIRLEDNLAPRIRDGRLMTLADRGRHVLVEMPEGIFLPLDRVLAELRGIGVTMILAHPERYAAAQADPERLRALVQAGCLLQITAGSLTGEFGSQVRRLAEFLVVEGLAHLVGTDMHGPGTRCSALRAAHRRVLHLAGEETAWELFRDNAARIAAGEEVRGGLRRTAPRTGFRRWFAWRKAG